jgi:hypothetical protein
MPKKEKQICFKHLFDQVYDVWSDLSDQEIESVEGVIVSEKFSGYRTIEIDMRYCPHSAMKELKSLAESKAGQHAKAQ